MAFGELLRTLLRPAGRVAPAVTGRDLRLDFFRGLALFFIFVDHIPNNVVSELTVRNFGFSDATEIFVFVSGYSAMLAYGSVYRRQGMAVAAAKVWYRCWQIYLAHIFLFVVLTAHVAYLARRAGNPLFVEEMGVVGFLDQPDLLLVEALLLRFKPANLDVLPLYVMLLLGFPLALWSLHRSPAATLAGSLAIYAIALAFQLNMPAYPPGQHWVFNPFAWQLLFVIGAFCGGLHGTPMWSRRELRGLLPLALLYLLFSFVLVLSWSWPALAQMVPRGLARLLYPISKTNLDVLRLLHFLALALVTVRLVGPETRFLATRWAAPVILCGRHSLQVFCTGIFLSFLAHFALTELSGTFAAQVAVSLLGIALMVGLAAFLDWFRERDRGGPERRKPAAAGAGGTS